MKRITIYSVMSALVVGVMLVFVISMALAAPPAQEGVEDLSAQGAYLTFVAGCIFCHTPYQEKYADFQNIGPEELQVLAFAELGALDTQNRLFAGGRAFDFGDLGMIFSPNLTPDKKTGLGEWTDDEIKAAIRTGVSRDGHILFPVMPYRLYNRMAESDLDAIIAYLRSLPQVENEISDEDEERPSGLFTEPLPVPEDVPAEAPDPSDIEARGAYLMSAVLPCTDCHTPIDPNTGAPNFEMYLAGGQPFEGPWGIVYGGNITPDEETGIGSWSDEDIKRVLTEGVRPDGRRVILMPWQSTAALTPEDLDAVVYFLRNTPQPVKNEVPAAALDPAFEQLAEPQS